MYMTFVFGLGVQNPFLNTPSDPAGCTAGVVAAFPLMHGEVVPRYIFHVRMEVILGCI